MSVLPSVMSEVSDSLAVLSLAALPRWVCLAESSCTGWSSSGRFGHLADGTFELGQVLVDRRLQDRVSSVEVTVGQVITHTGDLAPWPWTGCSPSQVTRRCWWLPRGHTPARAALRPARALGRQRHPAAAGQRPPPPVRRHPRHPEPPGDLPVTGPILDQLRRCQPQLLTPGPLTGVQPTAIGIPHASRYRSPRQPSAVSVTPAIKDR